MFIISLCYYNYNLLVRQISPFTTYQYENITFSSKIDRIRFTYFSETSYDPFVILFSHAVK